MSTLEGSYIETCSCDAVCPCTWSGLTAKATFERCKAALGFHVERGQLNGVDVGGTSFVLLLDTPAVMSEGGWKVGAFVDARATEEQRARLTALIAGDLGGPPAILGPLIGEVLGIEAAPIFIETKDGQRTMRVGDAIDVAVEDVQLPDTGGPVQLTNIFHPAGTTLNVAPAKRARVSGFGIEFGREGESGFTTRFNWSW